MLYNTFKQRNKEHSEKESDYPYFGAIGNLGHTSVFLKQMNEMGDGKEIYNSQCVGHKRIVPLGENGYHEITFRVTKAADSWALRDIAPY